MSLVTSDKYKKLEAARAAHAAAKPEKIRAAKAPGSSRRGGKRGAAASRSFSAKFKGGQRTATGATTKNKGPCVFFTRTGRCKRGLTCTYQHDPDKLSLCPRVLSVNGCTRKAKGKECLLSHTPNAHRVPHCSFYTRDRTCRNAERKDGKGCLYTHSDQVSPDTKPCEQFSELGYCERGQECEFRHTFECDEFAASGKCSKAKCRLLHIVSSAKKGEGEGEAQAGDDFIFERDDVAAFANDDDEEEEQGPTEEGKGKRKRNVDDMEDIEGDDTENMSRLVRKKRNGKSFITQQDYVSFGASSDVDDDDLSDEEEEEEENEGEEEEEDEPLHGDDEGDDDDEGEDEEEGDEEEDEEENDGDGDDAFTDAREDGSEDEASMQV